LDWFKVFNEYKCMLKIQNTDKLVGEQFIVPNPTTIWTVIGVHTYGPEGDYQIHLRTSDSANDRVFILKEEEGPSDLTYGLNANYKITDTFEPFNSVWVTEGAISSVSSMLRTLRRIISHANN
jgi:hypothetical protein